MKIFIYSPQREISYIIADHLSSKSETCIVFEKLEDLSSTIRNMKKGPDLLVMDYLSYNHDLFNVYSYLKAINKQIAVIFYNDPCLTRSTRVLHWKSLLEMTQPLYQKNDFTVFDDIFEKLQELVESKEFSQYISLLQPPKKVPDSLIKDKYTLQYIKDNCDDCITSFKTRNHLPNNLFYLLSLLQKNKTVPVKLNQLIDLYKDDGKEITPRSLKVYISQLKNIIRKDKECCFLINQDNGAYRFIRYK